MTLASRPSICRTKFAARSGQRGRCCSRRLLVIEGGRRRRRTGRHMKVVHAIASVHDQRQHFPCHDGSFLVLLMLLLLLLLLTLTMVVMTMAVLMKASMPILGAARAPPLAAQRRGNLVEEADRGARHSRCRRRRRRRRDRMLVWLDGDRVTDTSGPALHSRRHCGHQAVAVVVVVLVVAVCERAKRRRVRSMRR